ncbi:serine hydrolase domain-containing protein [Devosia sp.]|uniref:serine hydrolase domain-containing protein n=1 Tax=Devosia sp. TaxID=1871048 RepID=UPI003A944239
MRPDLPRAIAAAGFDDGTQLSIAVADQNGEIFEAVGGEWPDGRPVALTDRFYLASLAKQMTGAAAALLVCEARLDPNAPLSRYMPDLPGWANGVTISQLAHHTGGLPESGTMEDALGSGRWTSEYALAQLRQMPELPHVTGAAHIYSNAGYILLAEVVARQAGQSFTAFAKQRLLRPFELTGIGFASEPGSEPQWERMGPILPCSIGDGGVWTTAADFARWLAMMNRDELRLANRMTRPGRLSNGSAVDYGWGIGLRRHSGRSL